MDLCTLTCCPSDCKNRTIKIETLTRDLEENKKEDDKDQMINMRQKKYAWVKWYTHG